MSSNTELAGLVRSVLDEGDLPATSVIVDKLREIGDFARARRLSELLFSLVRGSFRLTESWKNRNSNQHDSHEEAAYRLDERRFRLWGTFCREVEGLFWLEINPPPDLTVLREVASILSAAKQAARMKASEKKTPYSEEAVLGDAEVPPDDENVTMPGLVGMQRENRISGGQWMPGVAEEGG